MDGMYSAIKNRRGGLLGQESGAPVPQAPSSEEGGGDMKDLVSSLDETQKSELLQMLVKDQKANETAPALEKGAMGPGEMSDLEEFVSVNEQGDGGDGHESEDEIMESMISSADKTRAEQGVKPRGLGERVKMNLASKLNKKKG